MTGRFFAGVALSCLTAAPLAADPAVFATPFDAVMAMVGGLEDKDRAGLLEVFGPESADFLLSDDEAENTRHRRTLLGLWEEGYRLVPQEDGSFVLDLGADGWPFPIPLAPVEGGWAFDIEAGRIEVADREIGLNELDVIALLEAYVDVQIGFRMADQDGDGVMEFAQKIIADEDRRDGLYWPEPDSPLGALLAAASADGYNDGTEDLPPIPYLGYVYRILTEQGPNAPGGAYSYLQGENMVGGHALLAVPYVYGETGVYSFMVSENGIILQADLGEDTSDIAAAITAYDPGPDWAPVEVTN